MKYFNFDSLIEKYSTDFVAYVPVEGYFDDMGVFRIGEETKVPLRGAILSFSENKILRSGGTITEEDRVLYTKQPVDRSLRDAKIVHEGREYSISNQLDNAEFTGVYAYTLKYVSVFNKRGGGSNG